MSEDTEQDGGSDVQQIKNPMMTMQTAAPMKAASGLVSVEMQRAVAEVQARMMIARANPREVIKATDLILEDCRRLSLAEDSVYQYARGGTSISGPSIRLAEAIARRWGNIASGIKEISRSNGYSECVAYAWDLESGYYDERQFQVRHWRDTNKGGYALKDERDIYELIANMGQRRKRAVLLSIIPGDVVEAARMQCEQTMKAKADTTPEGIAKMVDAFKAFGVTVKQLEAKIQRRIDTISPAQIVNLKKIYASLRDDMSTVEDWFEPDPTGCPTSPPPPPGTEGLKQKLSEQQKPKQQEPAATSPPPPPPAASASAQDTQQPATGPRRREINKGQQQPAAQPQATQQTSQPAGSAEQGEFGSME